MKPSNPLYKFLMPIIFASSIHAYADSCDRAKSTLPELSVKQKYNANAYYRNERDNAKVYGSSHRSKEEIVMMFRKLMHIKNIAQSCNIPARDISPEKYLELTGIAF